MRALADSTLAVLSVYNGVGEIRFEAARGLWETSWVEEQLRIRVKTSGPGCVTERHGGSKRIFELERQQTEILSRSVSRRDGRGGGAMFKRCLGLRCFFIWVRVRARADLWGWLREHEPPQRCTPHSSG